LLTADWSISNSLLISAAVRSEVILFDLSKMSAVSRRKTSADVIKTLKMSPFSDYLIATSAQPNYSVEVLNLRTNQTIGVLQKEPVTGLAWFKKRQILVSSVQ
jgi:WD40 repeat protein